MENLYNDNNLKGVDLEGGVAEEEVGEVLGELQPHQQQHQHWLNKMVLQ